MTRTWTAALAVIAFAAASLAASVALGGEAESDGSGRTAHVRLSSVATLPTLAKDPAVELAQARRAERRERLRARRERRRAAARRAAATELPAAAPAPAETATPAPEPFAPPVPPPAAAPAPAPTPAPAPAPAPETFDDSG